MNATMRCNNSDLRQIADAGELRGLWRKDFVAFALGCSYSFEQAIIDAGLRLHHTKNASLAAF